MVVGASLLAACAGISTDGTGDGGDGSGPSTSAATDTTNAPDTTTPDTQPPDSTTPDTAAPDNGDGDGLEASTIWVVAGLVVAFILLGWLMGRSRKPAAPAPVSGPTWKDHLREGYTEARWLDDAMTEELAIWRGNSMARAETTQPGTGLADRWGQLDSRMNRARDGLYKAEAAAPDQTSSQLVRNTIVALDATRTAIDARAEARLNSTGSPDRGTAERERIASTNLAESRVALNSALTSVSGLV